MRVNHLQSIAPTKHNPNTNIHTDTLYTHHTAHAHAHAHTHTHTHTHTLLYSLCITRPYHAVIISAHPGVNQHIHQEGV